MAVTSIIPTIEELLQRVNVLQVEVDKTIVSLSSDQPGLSFVFTSDKDCTIQFLTNSLVVTHQDLRLMIHATGKCSTIICDFEATDIIVQYKETYPLSFDNGPLTIKGRWRDKLGIEDILDLDYDEGFIWEYYSRRLKLYYPFEKVQQDFIPEGGGSLTKESIHTLIWNGK